MIRKDPKCICTTKTMTTPPNNTNNDKKEKGEEAGAELVASDYLHVLAHLSG